MDDLNWKYVGITVGLALGVVILYDYVLKDYMPGNKDS